MKRIIAAALVAVSLTSSQVQAGFVVPAAAAAPKAFPALAGASGAAALLPFALIVAFIAYVAVEQPSLATPSSTEPAQK